MLVEVFQYLTTDCRQVDAFHSAFPPVHILRVTFKSRFPHWWPLSSFAKRRWKGLVPCLRIMVLRVDVEITLCVWIAEFLSLSLYFTLYACVFSGSLSVRPIPPHEHGIPRDLFKFDTNFHLNLRMNRWQKTYFYTSTSDSYNRRQVIGCPFARTFSWTPPPERIERISSNFD